MLMRVPWVNDDILAKTNKLDLSPENAGYFIS